MAAVGWLDARPAPVAGRGAEVFTWSAAYAAHAEQDLGSIEPGQCGDLMLTDRDVMTVEPAQISGTTVLLTVIGGEIVYERAR